MSTKLTPNQKRLWRRMLDLDQPRGGKRGGCFASPAKLAHRLAMHPDDVIRQRRKLEKLGLIERSESGVKTLRWFPTLPGRIDLTRPEGFRSGRDTDAWLAGLGVELDNWLSLTPKQRFAETLFGGGRRMAVLLDTPSHKPSAREMLGTNRQAEKDESAVGNRRIVSPTLTNRQSQALEAVIDRLDKAVGQ